MEVYTHRGIGLGPENTHAAFRAAVDLGLNIEGDVGRTRNKTLVMMHDTTIDRTTNGSGLLRKKSDRTIAKLSANAEHGDEYADEEIPLCGDVLTRYGRQAKLILDIKANVAHQALELVSAADLLGRVRFNSESRTTLQTIKRLEEGARVGIVVEKSLTTAQIRQLARNGIDYISPDLRVADLDLIARCQDARMEIIPWVDGDERIWTPAMNDSFDTAIDAGVHGVIINHPHIVLEKLAGRSQSGNMYPHAA